MPDEGASPWTYIGVAKARKGVIRFKIVDTGDLWRVELTGDFMLYPEEKVHEVEEALSGPPRPVEDYVSEIRRALEGAEMLGCTVEDFIHAFLKAYEEARKRA